MSRVVIGPYKPDISLRNLFKKLPDRSEDFDGTQNDEAVELLPVSLDSGTVSSAVYLTEDWAERENEWDPGYKGIMVTENDLKHWENDHPLSHSVFALETKKSFIAGPDSLEEEDNAIEIARGKAIIGMLEPVEDATSRELNEALSAIGVEDAKHVIVMSEDREMVVPSILKQASVWDAVRDLHLVDECFESGHAFPGKRVNELQNAVGGAVNLLMMLEEAKAEMEGKGHHVPDTHKSYVSYYIKFLEHDESQPIPKEGIFISASEQNRRFLPVTQRHLDMEKAGVQLDLNDFDVPADYHGIVDEQQKPITIEKLRSDPHSGYFKHQFASARAMRALVEVMGIPKLEKPRVHELKDQPGARLISNLNFGEVSFAQQNAWGKDVNQLNDFYTEKGKGPDQWTDIDWMLDDKSAIPPEDVTYNQGNLRLLGYERVETSFRIESHEDLEQAFLEADGTVVEPWPKDAPKGVDPELYELEQKLVARMVISNRATIKPLGGASAIGRPLMINHQVRASEMPSYHNAVKFRTVTSRSEHVFRGFSDEHSFRSVMAEGQWDTEHMKKMPEKKPYHMIGADEFSAISGEKTGFVECLLGSASSHLKSGNEDAYKYTNESAKKTITMTHGGGGRFIMGQFFRGALDALKDGHNEFQSIAFRVPIASRKEGSLKPLLREYDMDVENGGFEGNYLGFGDNHFHSVTFDQMGERQHAIIAPAHVVTSFIGGVGTDYEIYTSLYHNLMVEERGYGIFPGFDNDQKKRVHFVNSAVKNGTAVEFGYFDALKESFTPEQREILNMHFYDTPEQALEARNEYAADLGYDLDVPRAEIKGGFNSYDQDDDADQQFELT